MDKDLERELDSTPAIPPITVDQRKYLTGLLDELDITLEEAMRDSCVNGDFMWDPEEIEDVGELSKRQASVLIDYLKQLRHER